jgi:hypothetical protein
VTRALDGGDSAPVEVLEYRLCEKFGWTITQLDDQPTNAVDKFITIMGIENQLKQAKEREQK